MADYKYDNKTYGRTITITHYANTKLKGRLGIHSKGEGQGIVEVIKYPLYVLVNVRRQVTQFKSMLAIDVAPGFGPGSMEEIRLIHSKEFNHESGLIVNSILSLKPFDSIKFNLNDAINDYRELAKDYSLIIEKYLRIALYDTLKEAGLKQVNENKDVRIALDWIDLDWPSEREKTVSSADIYYNMFNHGFNSGPFSIDSNYKIGFWVNYLRRYIPAVEELYNRLGYAIWNIKKYCDDIKMFKQWDMISIYEWNDKSFDYAFIEYTKNEAKLRVLKDGINELKACQPELNRLLAIV